MFIRYLNLNWAIFLPIVSMWMIGLCLRILWPFNLMIFRKEQVDFFILIFLGMYESIRLLWFQDQWFPMYFATHLQNMYPCHQFVCHINDWVYKGYKTNYHHNSKRNRSNVLCIHNTKHSKCKDWQKSRVPNIQPRIVFVRLKNKKKERCSHQAYNWHHFIIEAKYRTTIQWK